MNNYPEQNQFNNNKIELNGFIPNQNNGQYEMPLDTTNYQEYSPNQNATIADKPLLLNDNRVYNEEDELSFGEEIEKKSNLLFQEKQVSAFKLYCHLSEAYEIFLMIMGTLAAFASGVAAPLMCYLFGDMANDFGSVNVDEDQMEVLEQLMK